MRGSKVWPALCLPVLLLLCGTASAVGFEASVGYWNQDPSGHVSYMGMSGQDVLSVEDDLNYGSETRVVGRLKINAPALPGIYLMATSMEFSGRGSKGSTFQFGDITFEGGVPFSSEVTLNQYDIGLYYGIPGFETATGGTLNIDLGLDVKIIDLEARITGREAFSGITVTESESFTPPVPMLYLGIQLKPFARLSVEGEYRGGMYSGSHYFDCILRAKVKPAGPAFIGAGYRCQKLNIDVSDVDADARFGGLFGEVGVEF